MSFPPRPRHGPRQLYRDRFAVTDLRFYQKHYETQSTSACPAALQASVRLPAISRHRRLPQRQAAVVGRHLGVEQGREPEESQQVAQGALKSGVELGALTFCYDIATHGTLLAGSKLVLRQVPVVVFCPVCDADGELADLRSFRCPSCGTLTGDLRSGRELYVESLEAETPETETAESEAAP